MIGRKFIIKKCWCKSGKSYWRCHIIDELKIRIFKLIGIETPTREMIRTNEEIQGIRESGKINQQVLDFVAENLKAGMTTEEIDKLVYDKTVELGGIPATLDYEGYRKSVCISINDEVCHGVPSSQRIICEGDIVNVDASTLYKGYYADSARVFCIGQVSEERQFLAEVAKNAMLIGLDQVHPWHVITNISYEIQRYVLSQNHTVAKYVNGHGIGRQFHEAPTVNFTAMRGTGVLMVPGMVFTIEPAINQGSQEIITSDRDEWVVRTADGRDSAQWEVTVLVTTDGFEVLAW